MNTTPLTITAIASKTSVSTLRLQATGQPFAVGSRGRNA